jgi:hypothetical protein
MRMLTTIALLVVVCSPALAADQDIQLQLDLGYSANTNVSAPDPPRELGPFIPRWTIQGVEQSIETLNRYTGARRQREIVAPAIDHEPIIAGMWTPEHWIRTSDGHTYRQFGAPSNLPPFNPRWLTDDLWPLTQSLFGDDSGPLKRSFLVKPITLPRPASLLLAGKK